MAWIFVERLTPRLRSSRPDFCAELKVMTVYPLFDESSFDHDTIAGMKAAYDAALQLLQMDDRATAMTEILARKITEIARNGERKPPRMCARALKELGLHIA
jgi:hypothetical protein